MITENLMNVIQANHQLIHIRHYKRCNVDFPIGRLNWMKIKWNDTFCWQFGVLWTAIPALNINCVISCMVADRRCVHGVNNILRTAIAFILNEILRWKRFKSFFIWSLFYWNVMCIFPNRISHAHLHPHLRLFFYQTWRHALNGDWLERL